MGSLKVPKWQYEIKANTSITHMYWPTCYTNIKMCTVVVIWFFVFWNRPISQSLWKGHKFENCYVERKPQVILWKQLFEYFSCFDKADSFCIFVSFQYQQQNGQHDAQVRDLSLTGQVGFDSLPDQLVNKSVAKGFAFNILCVGKSSF